MARAILVLTTVPFQWKLGILCYSGYIEYLATMKYGIENEGFMAARETSSDMAHYTASIVMCSIA